MSVGLKLVCMKCRVGVYVGTSNSKKVEDSEAVGRFIWRHRNHELGTISESQFSGDPYYYGWPEEEELFISMLFKKHPEVFTKKEQKKMHDPLITHCDMIIGINRTYGSVWKWQGYENYDDFESYLNEIIEYEYD